MEWQPMSGAGLAVGCQSGICFWRLTENESDAETTASRNVLTSSHGRNGWCEFLCNSDNQQPVNTISWSPDGRLLASGSVSSDHIYVWDVATTTCTPLVAVASCGVSLIKWSPSGHYVFAATLSNVVRVWETKTWTGERWTIPTGPCQSACWNPQGTLLLVAVAGCADMWTFAFHHTPPHIFGVLADLRLNVGHIWGEHVSDDEGEDVVKSAASNKHRLSIREVAWSKDPFGQRLAVTVNVRGGHLKKGSNCSKRNRRKNNKENKKRGKSSHQKNYKEPMGGPITKDNQNNQQIDSDTKNKDTNEKDDQGEHKEKNDRSGTSDMVTLRDGEELILIYSVQIQPFLRFTPRGFLRGPKDGVKPYSLDFWPACDTGALLSACWLNGEVTLHPLLYEVKSQLYNGASMTGRDEEEVNTTLDEYDDDWAMTRERNDVYNQRSSFRIDW
jgi:hypothetical protein